MDVEEGMKGWMRGGKRRENRKRRRRTEKVEWEEEEYVGCRINNEITLGGAERTASMG
jgi:hypothetical protein